MNVLRHLLLLIAILAMPVVILGAQSGRGVSIASDPTGPPLVRGRQILVVIAVSHYEQWPPLAAPVRDAQEIRDILVSRYRIDQLYELYDAEVTKANIIRLIARLQDETAGDDSILILYCGHGQLDRTSGMGFWIPVNAGTDVYEQLNWLPHSQLKGMLANIAASHVLVVSDSCFAADLLYATRSSPISDSRSLREAYARTSRLVLTSGATEQVPDASEFARELKAVLRRNATPCLDASMLYSEIRLSVDSVVPLLGILSGTGHQEGGSFLLFLREDVASATQPTGRLTVATDRPGVLFIDGLRWGDLGEGSSELEGLGVGEHRITLAWDDGVSDEKRVMVDERTAETIFFFGKPPPTGLPVVPDDGGYLSAGTGFQGLVPVGDLVGIIGSGPCTIAKVMYNFGPPWGGIGVGLATGVIGLSTLAESVYDYDMLSFPVVAAARVEVALPSSWVAAFGIDAGILISRISVHGATPSVFSTSTLLLAPSMTIGLRLFRHLKIDATLGFLGSFFEGTPFSAVSVGVGAEYGFGRR